MKLYDILVAIIILISFIISAAIGVGVAIWLFKASLILGLLYCFVILISVICAFLEIWK